MKIHIISKNIDQPNFIKFTDELLGCNTLVADPLEADMIIVDGEFKKVAVIDKDKLPTRYINYENLMYNEFFK